jgi:hypothetical protein
MYPVSRVIANPFGWIYRASDRDDDGTGTKSKIQYLYLYHSPPTLQQTT